MGIYSLYTAESSLWKKTQPNQHHKPFLSIERDSYMVHNIRPFQKTLQHHLTLLQKLRNSEETFFFSLLAELLQNPTRFLAVK